MKKEIFAVLGVMVISTAVWARTEAKGEAQSTVEESTTRNPFTKKTTHKVVRKDKQSFRNKSGSGKVENIVEEKNVRSDNGDYSEDTVEEKTVKKMDQ